MPRASDELRAKFPGGDSEAFGVLDARCLISRGGVIRPKTKEDFVALSPREYEAIDYLCSEWDYTWSAPTAYVSASAAKCGECGGTGEVEEDATGALGYVVKRPCSACVPGAGIDAERLDALVAPDASAPGEAPKLWTEAHHDAQTWLAENISRSHAMGTCVDSLATLLNAVYNAGLRDAPRLDADGQRSNAATDKARLDELETALRSCLVMCEDCGTFATWDAKDRFGASYRRVFCDICKDKRENEREEGGRHAGEITFTTWQRLTRNVGLTRIYAASAVQDDAQRSDLTSARPSEAPTRANETKIVHWECLPTKAPGQRIWAVVRCEHRNESFPDSEHASCFDCFAMAEKAECPFCLAGPGQSCVGRHTHRARVKAALRSNEAQTFAVDDVVRGCRREPDGRISVGRVAQPDGGGPTIMIDWWSGPNRSTCIWFPRNAIVPVDAPDSDNPLGVKSPEREAIAAFLERRGLLGEANAVRWWKGLEAYDKHGVPRSDSSASPRTPPNVEPLPRVPTFEEAWVAVAAGRQYGEDALENVRAGWDLHEAEREGRSFDEAWVRTRREYGRLELGQARLGWKLYADTDPRSPCGANVCKAPRLREELLVLRAPPAAEDDFAPLRAHMAKGRQKYPNGCTALSLLDEAGKVAHALNKYESPERVREEILDVAGVAMRLYLGEIDRGLIINGLEQGRTDQERDPQ